MTRPSTSSSAPRSRHGTKLMSAGRLPLFFVGLSLLALAVLPVVQAQRIAEIEEEISRVLEPARSLGQRLALLQAREMARLQAYLVTGEPRFRIRHEGLMEEEREVYDELQAIVERADLGVRGQLVEMFSSSQQWHVGHRSAFEDDAARLAYLDRLSREQDRYDEVLAAARSLQATIGERVDDARRRMERAREVQLWLTLVLAGLALAATVTVGAIGRRLQTALRRADEGQRAAVGARREMEAVLEATGDGVVGVDLEGRCSSLNRTASAMLGYSETDARGRDVHALLHGRAPAEEVHSRDDCPAVEALTSGESVTESHDVIWRRDGTSFPAQLQVRPLVDGLEVKGAVVTVTDMTEIRAAEEALRRAVRARDQVVAVVSHDLRNPLGSVTGAAELLMELELPPEEEARQLDIIQRAARRMDRLVDDLLDAARIEAGGLKVEPRPEPVEPLVRAAVELLAPAAEAEGLQLRLRSGDELPLVRADRSRVEQVLANLVENAIKFSEPGGRIEVDVTAADGDVRIGVIDTGPGIAPEDVERLFDRFWQGGDGATRGSGLGLAIAKGIVDAHGGRIWVESRPGEGSTFYFTLPTVEEDPAAQPDEPAGSRVTP